jgi:hypothetical protein
VSSTPTKPTNAIFTTLKALNPEKPTASDPNLNAHTVLLSKPEAGLLVLGFEDLNRAGGDHDFNDVLIAIQVTPFSAIDRTQVQALVKTVVLDSDGDSIPDTLDAFPSGPGASRPPLQPQRHRLRFPGLRGPVAQEG